jgi:hypothetical protein
MNVHACRRFLGFLALALLGVLVACARVRPLEGGPPDQNPPRLVRSVPPDSAVSISRLPRFELEFDEPVATNSARMAVRFEPFIRVGDVRVHGRFITITTAESLPADTSVVLVLAKGLQDLPQRGNKLREEIRLLYCTGPRLRAAGVRGRVTVKGQVNPKTAVRFERVPPDTTRSARPRRDPVTSVNAEGLFRLEGLPPGRAFVLRAFLDQNDNMLPDEGELAAVYPETLQLAVGTVRRGLAWNVIDPNEPGELSGVVLNTTPVKGPLAIGLRNLAPPRRADSTAAQAAETLAVRADTLRPLPLPVPIHAGTAWEAAYLRLEPRGFVRRDWVVVYASPRGDYSVRVPPGRHALVAFVDARRDSVPGMYVLADSSALAWEPLCVGDTLQVPAGVKVRARTIQIREP